MICLKKSKQNSVTELSKEYQEQIEYLGDLFVSYATAKAVGFRL